tara:strand:+ start:360 stop:521 length:162 start_codon:yes stop_codon:yes gene_type:complete
VVEVVVEQEPVQILQVVNLVVLVVVEEEQLLLQDQLEQVILLRQVLLKDFLVV